MNASDPGGPRLLIVEDEALIAMYLEEEMARAGYRIAGMAPSIPSALRLLEQTRPDAAILDLRLGGQDAYPVADAMQARNVPFLFVSGHGPQTLPPRYRDVPCVMKPFVLDEVLAVVAGILDGRVA